MISCEHAGDEHANLRACYSDSGSNLSGALLRMEQQVSSKTHGPVEDGWVAEEGCCWGWDDAEAVSIVIDPAVDCDE